MDDEWEHSGTKCSHRRGCPTYINTSRSGSHTTGTTEEKVAPVWVGLMPVVLQMISCNHFVGTTRHNIKVCSELVSAVRTTPELPVELYQNTLVTMLMLVAVDRYVSDTQTVLLYQTWWPYLCADISSTNVFFVRSPDLSYEACLFLYSSGIFGKHK